MYGVVPDATWNTSAGRAALRSHLQTIQSQYPGHPASVSHEDRRIRLGRLFSRSLSGSRPRSSAGSMCGDGIGLKLRGMTSGPVLI